MIKKLIEDINLAIKLGFTLELVLYIRYSCSFFGFCEDIEVVIRGLKIKYLIFIIEARNYNLILDQSFLNSIKFSQKYKPDKIFDIITYLYIY